MKQTESGQRTSSHVKASSLVVFLCCLFALFATASFGSLRGTDFPNFYCAARIVLDGHGRQLYSPEIQREYQARYVGGVSTLYAHPPFESLLYVSVAWLPIRFAYLLWFLVNLVFLAAALRCLVLEALPHWDWRILLAASFTFVPVLLCLIQGQDSMFFLLLIVFAFAALRRERAFVAGCWLGVGLCKFQIVLPLVAVLLLTQGRTNRNGLSKGFGLVAALLAGLSTIVSGWSVFSEYPRFLVALQNQPSSGISPLAMANLRGLVFTIFQGDRSTWGNAAVLFLSVILFFQVISIWTKLSISSTGSSSFESGFDFAFGHTVLFALLVSYYLNPHDLMLLLLPVTLLMNQAWEQQFQGDHFEKWTAMVLLAIISLPPLYLVALRFHRFNLVSLPVIAVAFVGNFMKPGRLSPETVAHSLATDTKHSP